MRVIHILTNLYFYPYLIIHIFQILENLSICCYPYGYMDITFQVGIIMVRSSNFRDKNVYPYGYNSQNFNHIEFIHIFRNPENLSIQGYPYEYG